MRWAAIKVVLLTSFWLLNLTLWAQTTDSFTTYDSTEITVRHFDETKLQQLQNDPQLTYSADRASVSLWQQLWWFFMEIIGELFDETASSDVGRLLIYILAVVLLVFIIIRVLKIESLKLFFSKPDDTLVDHTVIEENIHEMDFNKLMEEALRKNDYRVAIRLTFLLALKLLSDKHLVYWEPGKTNHDYMNELQSKEIKKGFTRLNYYFEYAWYGNFTVDDRLYKEVNKTFGDWKGTLMLLINGLLLW